MANATFGSLVNDTIDESGTHLDQLDSVTWATTTDPMHRRFKKWVREAYKRIQMDRGEWEFRSKKATVIVSPRIQVQDGDYPAVGGPAAGVVVEGTETQARLTVLDSILLNGTWAGGNAEAIVEFKDLTDNFKLNEPYDEITPDPLNLEIFKIKSWGKWNLRDIVPDLEEVDQNSFYIQTTGGSTVQPNDSGVGATNLRFINYNFWKYGVNNEYFGGGAPTALTISSDGWLDLYPKPRSQYVLQFDYTANPVELNAWADEVTNIPEIYQDAIKWMAVYMFAQYNENERIRRLAEKELKWYMSRMDSKELVEATFGTSVYNGPGFWIS